eukprot:TRINITY_DN18965_c0_g1_i1.p1 TRINITY_DN18965_c0_g1~~TRINITY_DN18965_c0_g1_i1.p1  ORF type:complete len:754 (-),score=148.29 TRINITY_DN18965_c0_g1_i1:57-2318(-)
MTRRAMLALLRLLVLCLLPELARPDKLKVQWHISIAWEDQSCESVCFDLQLRCIEDCWPFTAKGLEFALEQPSLEKTCFGVEAGNPPLPWYPAKDADNSMCYWFGGKTASDAPRCPLKPQTSASLLEDAKVNRRICPCVNASTPSDGLDCGVGGQIVDPAPSAWGWVPPTLPPTTTVETAEQPLPSVTADSGGAFEAPAPPPPPPPVQVPPVPACQELCVSGFMDEDEKLNGKYVRLSASDGSLAYWLRFGGLPGGSDCRLALGRDDTWRYYQVSNSQVNTSIGEGTLKAMDAEMPQDDYVMTPTGGYQVEYQCCPILQVAGSSSIGFTAAVKTVEPQDDTNSGDTLRTVLIIAGVAAALGLIPACCILACRSRSRARRYEEFDDPAFKLEDGKDFSSTSNTWHHESPTNSPAGKTWHSSFSLQSSVKAAAESKFGRGGTWRGREEASQPSNEWLPNHHTADRSSAAVETVLGKSSTMAAEDGIYEGPTRKWWNRGNKKGGAPVTSNGLDGTGFHIGSAVRLRGLQAASWNGAEGHVEGYNAAQGALEIRLSDGRSKLVKPENCVDADTGFGSSQRERDITPAELRNQLNASRLGLTEEDSFANSYNSSKKQRQPHPDLDNRIPHLSSSNVSSSNITFDHAPTNTKFGDTTRVHKFADTTRSRVSFDKTVASMPAAPPVPQQAVTARQQSWRNSPQHKAPHPAAGVGDFGSPARQMPGPSQGGPRMPSGGSNQVSGRAGSFRTSARASPLRGV